MANKFVYNILKYGFLKIDLSKERKEKRRTWPNHRFIPFLYIFAGSFVMNPLSEVIIHALGLKDALRILALVVMVIGIPCCLVFKQPPMQDTSDDSSVSTDDVEPPQPRSIYDTDSAWLAEMIRKETNPPGSLCFGMRKDLWTEPVFILFLIGQFTKGIGYVFPFVHLVSHIGPALWSAILFLYALAVHVTVLHGDATTLG